MTAPRKRHRRDFLRGRSAADALAGAVDRTLGEPLPLSGPASSVASPSNLDSDSAEGYLVRMSRRAMACEFEIVLTAGQYPQGMEAAVAALDLVDQLEDQLSVFREHSEISGLNRAAHESPQPVEERLFNLLALAVRLHQQSSGAFDITAGPLSRVWGFTAREGKTPSEAALAEALARVGSQKIELDHAARTARYAAPGMEINLGAIGKGYALDRAAESLASAGVRDVVLHGGQSSVLARGARRPGPDEAGWLVGLPDPLRTERLLAQIRLRDRALGTSGSGTQFFLSDGRRQGHLLDPRTGRPAEGVLSATAIAPSAAEADSLATAFYVLGPEGAAEFCRAHGHVAALITTPGRRAGSVELHAFGLEKEPGGGSTPIFSA